MCVRYFTGVVFSVSNFFMLFVTVTPINQPCRQAAAAALCCKYTHICILYIERYTFITSYAPVQSVRMPTRRFLRFYLWLNKFFIYTHIMAYVCMYVRMHLHKIKKIKL